MVDRMTTRSANGWTRRAALIGSAATLAACGAPGGDIGGGSNGVTDDSIRLGQSWPTSGAAAAVFGPMLDAIRAWQQHLNATEGGVMMADGKLRRIDLRTADDGLDPSRAIQNARYLVERENVFAMISPAGTANSTAISTYTERASIPLLYVLSGARHWTDTARFRWSVGLQPSSEVEGRIWARWLARNHPGARIGLLRDNTDFGHDLEYGLQAEIAAGALPVTIAAVQGYQPTDTTLASQITNLRAAGSNVFFNGATPQFAALGYKALVRSGWEPELNLLTNASPDPTTVIEPAGYDALQGVRCLLFLKDPADPQFIDSLDVVLWREVMERYSPRTPRNQLTFWASSLLQATVETLRAAEAPTRRAVMDAAHTLDATLPALAPGIRIRNTPQTNRPISQFALGQLVGEHFQVDGEVIGLDD